MMKTNNHSAYDGEIVQSLSDSTIVGVVSRRDFGTRGVYILTNAVNVLTGEPVKDHETAEIDPWVDEATMKKYINAVNKM